MVFSSALCIISLCAFFMDVNSDCTVRHNHENGLPLGIKELPKDDYIGSLLMTFQKTYVSLVKNTTLPVEFCEIGSAYVGKLGFQFSFRPVGCCSYCCFIDNFEDRILINVLHGSKIRARIRLSDKQWKGKLTKFGIDSELNTIFVVPGYSEAGPVALSASVISEAYLKRNESYNVINVDFSDVLSLPWYIEAVDVSRNIAEAVAKFIIFYHKTGDLSIDTIHIIGISLGAQLSGLIGKEIGKFRKVGRITGLDPAYPIYSAAAQSDRLWKEDANFVDIIHTNPGSYGFPYSVGHADFYISHNGTIQRGCGITELAIVNLMAISPACDHLHSLFLYLETVADPKLFPVVTKTSNTTTIGYLGHLASKSTTIGDYYLNLVLRDSFVKYFK